MGDVNNLFSGLIKTGSFAGTDLGFPGNTVELVTSQETVKLTTGDSRTARATLTRSKDYQLRMSLAEYTYTNLALGLAQPATNVGSSGSYLLATGDDADTDVLIVTIENEQGSTTDTLRAPQAKPSGSDTITWDKENQGFINVTFDLNADSNGNAFEISRA